MAETPPVEAGDDQGLSIDPGFHNPDRALARRQHALDLAREMFDDNPTVANAALVRTLELDVAEHTPLDKPLQPPTDVT
ncbi:hypothetical protein KC957_01400 [Candidatus Saccharibacteria bacterium]|nr:hypothetical protein [Candidatus Saccharibacteria bacterium]